MRPLGFLLFRAVQVERIKCKQKQQQTKLSALKLCQPERQLLAASMRNSSATDNNSGMARAKDSDALEHQL
eukprot:6468123-Amphidinium_carterae.2